MVLIKKSSELKKSSDIITLPLTHFLSQPKKCLKFLDLFLDAKALCLSLCLIRIQYYKQKEISSLLYHL